MNEAISIFLLAALGSFIALGGGIIFLFSTRLSETLEEYSIPFAAGVLVTVSMLGLLPEAVEAIGPNAFFTATMAFFASFLFDHVIVHLHHHTHKGHKNANSSIPLVIIGDTIHNFIDGVTIAVGYLASPGLGLIAALSTLLHEVPHEIGDFGILLRAGWKKRNILVVNALSASVTILGAFFVYFFAAGSQAIGYLLAISAGLFLYLGAADFLPQIGEEKNGLAKNIVPLIAGVFIMLLTLRAVPHEHGHEGGSADSHLDTPYEDNHIDED